MPVSVKGVFENGVAKPSEQVEGREGQKVIITFVEEMSKDPAEQPQPSDKYDQELDEFEKFLDSCVVDTGIGDLAHQHDHYLYGTPKREQ